MFKQFQIVSFDEANELLKAHVKAHFRRDTKTGKLIFIQNYDSKVHGKADHEIHAGTQMKIDNPKSIHHGKMADIKGYITPANTKKSPYVSVTVNGVRADLKPHHFVPVSPAAVTPPPTPKPTTPATPTPPAISLGSAKAKLGLIGKSYTHPDLVHEGTRVRSLTYLQCVTRIGKIKSPQKLYDFYRALDIIRPFTTFQQQYLSHAIEQAIIDHANKTQPAQAAPVPPKTPVQAPPPQSPAPTPAPAPGAIKAPHAVGDIVEIKTGKYTGKKGKITHMGGKFGIRVRVDLDGKGDYTKIAEYKKPDISFAQTSAPAAPAPTPAAVTPDSDATRGKDKKKRKPRSDKGTGDPDPPPAAQAPVDPVDPDAGKTMIDFANDVRKAYKLAPADHKDLAIATGILPLDEDTKNMMSNAMRDMVKYLSSSQTASGSGEKNYTKLPKWAKGSPDTCFQQGINSYIDTAFSGDPTNSSGYPSFGKPLAELLKKPKEEWEKAGYNYELEIAPVINLFKETVEKHRDMMDVHNCPATMNSIVNSFVRINKPNGYDMAYVSAQNGAFDRLMDSKYDINSKLKDILNDPDIIKANTAFSFSSASNALAWAHYMSGNTNARIDEDITVKDLISGVLKIRKMPTSNDRNVRDHFHRINDSLVNNSFFNTQNAKMGNLIQSSGSSISFSRYTQKTWSSIAEDWRPGNSFRGGSESTEDILAHVVGQKNLHSAAQTNKKWGSGYYSGDIFSPTPIPLTRLIAQSVDQSIKNMKVSADFKDNFNANHVAKQATSRYSKAGEYKPTIFDRDLKNDIGPRFAGLSAGRKTKGTEFNALAMAKKYIAARKKGAHLTAPDDSPTPAKATLKKVDAATHKKVVDRVIQGWDNGAHSSFKPKIHGVYQIGGMAMYEKFKAILDKDDNEQYAYHGTNTASAANIIRDKYSLDKVAFGRMLGPGVYVAKTSSKASQYVSAGQGQMRVKGVRGVMFLNKTSMGKVFDKAYSPDNNNAPTSHKGNHDNINTAHTIYGPKDKTVPGYNSTLANDEHCVKMPDAVLPMYWIDMELV